jgi:hypothetical protein
VLSPVSAEALSSVVGDTGWTSLSFKDFIAAFSQKEQNGGLMVELLADYARSTNALLHILNASSSAAECFCRENQYSFNDFWRTLKRSDFQHLRIHDVVKKFAYDNLQRLLVEHCKTSEEQLLSNIALLDHPSSFKFLAETFMSRAQPGVNFEFVIKTSDAENGRAVAVGVQIQGTIYRHFIKVSHPIDFDGTGLSGLARLLGDPTQLNDVSRRWWRADLGNQMVLRVASNGDFKPFGKEAFLYTDVDVATMNYQDLVLTLRRSLQAVRAQISDSMEFREAVIEFIQGG